MKSRLTRAETFNASRVLFNNKKLIQEFVTKKEVCDFVKQKSGISISECNAQQLLKDVGIKLKTASKASVRMLQTGGLAYERTRKDIRTTARAVVALYALLGVKRADIQKGNDLKNYDALLRVSESISVDALNLIGGEE